MVQKYETSQNPKAYQRIAELQTSRSLPRRPSTSICDVQLPLLDLQGLRSETPAIHADYV